MPENIVAAGHGGRWRALLKRPMSGSMPLVAASLAAQLIAFLISPILTRLFAPGEMGLFALYSSAISILVLLSTGRYDMAIISPARDTRARALVYLVALISTAFFGAALLALALFSSARWSGMHQLRVPLWAWIVPFGVFLAAAQAASTAYLTRKMKYGKLAAVRLIAAVLSSGLSILFGWLQFGAIGLILAALAGVLLGVVLAQRATGLPVWPRVAAARAIAAARQYVNYPRIDLPSSLLGVAASQLPTMLVGACFGAPALGLYALVDRILAAPLITLGGPLGAAFRVEATSRVNRSLGFRTAYVRTLLLLALLSALIYVPILFFGEAIFAAVFGTEWRAAGRMAQLLAILYFVRLITSPLSVSLYVRNRMQADLCGQFALCLLSLAAIIIGWKFNDVYLALILIAGFNSCVYLTYIIYGYAISKD
jgi:O-antigen/teichoic acid export membrane protein